MMWRVRLVQKHSPRALMHWQAVLFALFLTSAGLPLSDCSLLVVFRPADKLCLQSLAHQDWLNLGYGVLPRSSKPPKDC
jgi:hypothetical protein